MDSFLLTRSLDDLKGSIAAFDIVHNKKLIIAKGKRVTVQTY